MSSSARRCSFDAFVALAVVLFICAVPGQSAAQVLYGSIVGDVKDSSGAGMPGATVLVTNNNTGFKREAVTDGVGHFNLFDLPAGSYSLKATQLGFRTFEQTQVTVSINTVTRIDVTMEIGAMGDNVTVRAEAPVLQTETAEVHSNLSGQELTTLPVPLGGNYQQIYRMLPGFAPPFNSHSIPTNPARSLEFSVNGTSDDQNNTRIDGVSGSFDAEQGLAGGAAINVQTRSGSNVMHGSGFEHFTNQHLKAWPMRFD